MKFNLQDHTVALSHVILKDQEIATLLADTDKWKNDGVFEAKLLVNGVEIPASIIEDTLQDLYKRCEEHYSKTYDANNIDKLVEERAQQLLKDHAEDALSKLSNLVVAVEGYENLLKPYWERK